MINNEFCPPENGRKLTDVLKSYKRICWNPSSGTSFRALLYLSEQFLDVNNEKFKERIPKEELPDLFVLTDVNPFSYNTDKYSVEKVKDVIFRKGCLYGHKNDTKTRLAAQSTEWLETPEIPLHRELVGKGGVCDDMYGKACLMRVEITSKYYSDEPLTWQTDMVYFVAENTAFAFDYLMKNDIKPEYLMYMAGNEGRDFSMTDNSPNWFRCVLDRLCVRYFLSSYPGENDLLVGKYIDTEKEEKFGDIIKIYGGEIFDTSRLPELKHIMMYGGNSGYPDVGANVMHWFKVMHQG